MSKTLSLLYISDGYTNMSVFKSQVHTLCNAHVKDGVDVTLLALCDKDEMVSLEPKDTLYKTIKIKRLSKIYIPWINHINAKLCKNKELFIHTDLIHCRGHLAAAFCLNILKKYSLKKPVIADIRGEIVAEFQSQKRFFSNFYIKQVKHLESNVFNKSDYFFFVSENMKMHYCSKFQLTENRIAIFPTIVNENLFYISCDSRMSIRNDFNITNEIVYVYAGGISFWQNIDKIFIKFDEKYHQNKNLFLIMIVTNVEYTVKLAQKLNIDMTNIRIINLQYEEVGKYLNAGDFGLIIRDNSLLNHVASPTKINEYLACGLKICDKLEEIGNIEYRTDQYTYKKFNDIIIEQKDAYKNILSKELS